MARNRMIKPEFWSSETLMRVSRDARLTFIALWNFCDDYGFCLNSRRSLIGDLYPLDEDVTEAKIKEWINELIGVSLLIPIEYKNKRLLFVKGWGEHQTVQHKSKRSFVDVDDLEHVITTSLKSHEDLINIYLESHAPKKKEKEKEKEKVKEERESNKENKQDERVQEVLLYLNNKLNKKFRTAKGLLKRFSEGHTVEDAKYVIDVKCKEWVGTDYARFLVPDTLFSEKFDKYLNQDINQVNQGKNSQGSKELTDADYERMFKNAFGS